MNKEKFEELNNMTNAEIKEKYVPLTITKSCTYDQIIQFLLKHNAVLYINQLCREFQFTKEDILNVLLNDTQFNRNGRVLGGDLSVKENAARAIIKQQKSFDEEVFFAIIKKFSDSKESEKRTYFYLKKMINSKSGIENKNFDLNKFLEMYPEKGLELELN